MVFMGPYGNEWAAAAPTLPLMIAASCSQPQLVSWLLLHATPFRLLGDVSEWSSEDAAARLESRPRPVNCSEFERERTDRAAESGRGGAH